MVDYRLVEVFKLMTSSQFIHFKCHEHGFSSADAQREFENMVNNTAPTDVDGYGQPRYEVLFEVRYEVIAE